MVLPSFRFRFIDSIQKLARQLLQEYDNRTLTRALQDRYEERNCRSIYINNGGYSHG